MCGSPMSVCLVPQVHDLFNLFSESRYLHVHHNSASASRVSLQLLLVKLLPNV